MKAHEEICLKQNGSSEQLSQDSVWQIHTGYHIELPLVYARELWALNMLSKLKMRKMIHNLALILETEVS